LRHFTEFDSFGGRLRQWFKVDLALLAKTDPPCSVVSAIAELLVVINSYFRLGQLDLVVGTAVSLLFDILNLLHPHMLQDCLLLFNFHSVNIPDIEWDRLPG